ncbi:nuclear transport factor 2 family protein [Winogradskyella haliclonae]|uniref:SnoaL-like domain-containing protein n=1 Tax=Winogradskyella haliclonae TaxID=2048558 RepID=A0ABQ2BYJ8_9FLAO|nr:nuclear transport factor 2 family protein [Winogradskyella haliclonae]GGI57589.1 hypothetical protein GCM10011444_18980 [Winogradskyella haliclonae]
MSTENTGNKKLVKAYLNAQINHDFSGCRSLLDDDFHFKGPIEEHFGADNFMLSFEKFIMIIKSIEIEQLIEERDDVLALYNFTTDIPTVENTRTAEVFTIRGNKIIKSRLFFDTPEWREVIEKMMNI